MSNKHSRESVWPRRRSQLRPTVGSKLVSYPGIAVILRTSTKVSLCAGPRDEKTADEEAHRRVGHIFCGFVEGQMPAYEYLKEELPRLAASLTIIPIAVEDRDPR